MKNIICISTGLVYKITENWDRRIELLQQFHPDGIELCFAYVDQILNFKINTYNRKYLKNLKRLSIHGPWEPIIYSQKNKQAEHILSKIEKLNEELNSKNVNFDCFSIKDYDVFQKYNFQTSIENCDWRKKPKTPQDFFPILKINKTLMLNLDIAHSLTLDPDPTLEFIKKFEQKISQIHLSYLNRNIKEHTFIHIQSKDEIEKIISYLHQIPKKIPLVLECVATSPKEVTLIRNEINFLKSI